MLKMSKIMFCTLITALSFTACTDESDPVVQPVTPPATDSLLLLSQTGSLATVGDSLIYEAEVKTATRMSIAWIESGSTDNGGETADIKVSVVKMDGVTPYKQIGNNKNFLNIDNSATATPKEIYADQSETKFKIKVKLNSESSKPGSFKIIVKENPLILATDDTLATVQDLKVYEINVKNATKVEVYWKELGTTESGNDKTADIQGSVYKLDGTTPYIIIDNQKPFVDKDKSSYDNPKSVLIDQGESKIKVQIAPLASNPNIGTYALYVKSIK